MMENRSFDHLLGFLKRDKNSNIDGLMGGESNPYNPSNPNSPRVKVTSTSPYVDPNAGHSYPSTRLQIFGTNQDQHPYPNPPPMNGFVADAESREKGWGPEVLSCFNYSSLPVLTTLALEFGMIDKWYSSLPGPTEPNRAFLHSCSSNGYLDNNEYELGIGFPQRTMFTALGDAGYSWKVYYDVFPSALFMRELREYPFNFHGTAQFVDDCASGNLPFYSFVEPSYFSVPTSGPANDQHPDHNVEDGEKFIKKIYEALRASPLWNKTAFIITYDEHGGFYDHAPTPVVGVPNPDGIISAPPYNFTFDRLGIRVPAIIVSPWVQKGALVHEPEGPMATSQFEHCSVAATLKKLYNVPKLPLNKRDAWAGTFESMFTSLSAPRTDCPAHLPDPPTPREEDLPPHKRNLPNKRLNDLQLGMVETANYLGGKVDDISVLKTEQEGGNYVLDRLTKFFEEKKQAIRRKQAVQSEKEL
jgi:phospholipase C